MTPSAVAQALQMGPPPRTSSINAPRTKFKETRFGDYILGQTLGEGEFGKVKLGWRKDGGEQAAIKLIRREVLKPDSSRLSKVHREIAILRTVQHPNIVRLQTVIETDRYIGMVLDYASGGELFDYILNHRYLKDSMASKLFAQLVSGVSYLHTKGIVHRDLKLENLLLDRNGGIIITDFGFANVFDSDNKSKDLMATSCGSPCYAAPELVVTDGTYEGCKVDVWSCGVILYAMLAGYLPFDDDPANPEGDNINLLYKYIVNTPLTFPEYVTPKARNLLHKMLVPNPTKRANLRIVAEHDYLSGHEIIHDIRHRGTGKQLQSVDMERSTSARDANKPSTSTSFLGSQTHRNDSKRHTVQIEYNSSKAPHRPTLGDLAATIASLDVSPAPALARSVTDHEKPSITLASIAERPSTAQTFPHSRLPVPTKRPRPTSYHPVLSLDTSTQATMSDTASSTSSMRRHRNSYSQPSGSAAAATNTIAEAEITTPIELKPTNGHRRSNTISDRISRFMGVDESRTRRFSLIPTFVSTKEIASLASEEPSLSSPVIKQGNSPSTRSSKHSRRYSFLKEKKKPKKWDRDEQENVNGPAKRVMDFFRRRGRETFMS